MEHPVRFCLCEGERTKILFKQHLAAGEPLRHPRLAAAFRPFDQQRTRCPQHPGRARLSNAAAVTRRCER